MNSLVWITGDSVELAFLRATRSFILGSRESGIHPDSLIRSLVLDSLNRVFSGIDPSSTILTEEVDIRTHDVTLADVYLYILKTYRLSWRDPILQERFSDIITNQINYELSLEIEVPEFFKDSHKSSS